jgi:3-hydroxymyristoyl/3-hydroxydecanoyl-(acyl carrier protein) dehydratase
MQFGGNSRAIAYWTDCSRGAWGLWVAAGLVKAKFQVEVTPSMQTPATSQAKATSMRLGFASKEVAGVAIASWVMGGL